MLNVVSLTMALAGATLLALALALWALALADIRHHTPEAWRRSRQSRATWILGLLLLAPMSAFFYWWITRPNLDRHAGAGGPADRPTLVRIIVR